MSGPQRAAYLSDADETLYGGAAGGGKTDLLCGLALTAHRRSVIFRREYPQLKAVVERLRELDPAAGWNGQDMVLRAAGGRVVELGAVKDATDWRKWQGRPHDFLGFDELPNFLESQYVALCAWNRTTTPGQRCRVVAAGNPPTSADGEWVIRRWGAWVDRQHPRPARPGELRWYARVGDKEVERPDGTPFTANGRTVTPRSRTFIPARLADNPYLLSTGYAGTLDALPEPLRSQLRDGDFGAGRKDDPWQVVPTEWVRKAQARWHPDGWRHAGLSAVGVDVARGGADKTVLARRHGGWFAPLDKHPGKDTPDGQAVAGLVLAALAANEPNEGRQLAAARAATAAVNVDVIGVGSSVYDTLRGHGLKRVAAVNFAARESRKDRARVLEFANLRAYAYWALREALDPEKGDGLALPPDPELLADLCAPTWSMQTSGVRVEPKDDIAARIGRSPDCGDAVVLAALPVVSAGPWRLESF